MEEEVRQILKTAVLAPERLGDRFLSYFGPSSGANFEISARKPHEPIELK
jgi:antitoxin FitA